jgi:secreted trypsin-like serine protease
MKKVSILAVLVLTLAVGLVPAAAITGGVEDGDGHPAVGLMVADVVEDGVVVDGWRCSGTLIAPQVFLTAGHCTGDGATTARVWFANDMADVDDYPDGGGDAIEGIPVPHPDYNWGDADPHDVGLVILSEPVDIEPAQLPDPDLLTQLKKDRILEGGYGNSGKEDVLFRSVGYGLVLLSWPPPELDGSEKIRQVAESEYVSLTKSRLHLSQKAVFGESGSCFGDSGGPVFWVDDEGNESVAAVTSSGDAQCVATGLNYRVDTPEILEWVNGYLPEGE